MKNKGVVNIIAVVLVAAVALAIGFFAGKKVEADKYAQLLQKLGYDASAVVLGDINNETKCILEKAGLDAPQLLEDASGCNMVLMDHSDYEQSADGLQDANIIFIIDHHGDGSVRTGNRLFLK